MYPVTLRIGALRISVNVSEETEVWFDAVPLDHDAGALYVYLQSKISDNGTSTRFPIR